MPDVTAAATARAGMVARLRERGHIGDVRLKRFGEPTEQFVAEAADE
jgi:hypothetical protein